MSSSMAEDAEDVNNFLKRIQELGTKRDQEDEERNRKLEEEILQGRKERQARRAERARSISPSKDSPIGTPTHHSSPSFSKPALSPKPDLQPRSRDKTVEDPMDRRSVPSSPTKENVSPYGAAGHDDIGTGSSRPDSTKASPSSAMPTRTPTLSWQQRRPNSQASDRPRSRPLSMIATENAARSPKATPEPSPEGSEHPPTSRDQISQMLGSKDPAWFRQTADRGENSPAYRKNQVEDSNVVDVVSSSRVQLPGMSRDSVRQSAGSNHGGADLDRSNSPSRNSSSNGSAGRTSYTGTTLASSGLGSPVPLTSAQRFDPPASDNASVMDASREAAGRVLAMSPSQGRISPERLERSPSPTKGMGGFVQSAMMKRSDSVNKRWSVQSPPGLSRGNSVASNRSSYDATATLALGGVATREPRPSSLSRDNSPLPQSRPTSSHSNVTIVQENERPGASSSARSSFTTTTDIDGFVKPSLPGRSQVSSGSRDEKKESSKELQIDTTPPTSPSKPGDRARWSPTKSPTKSSWLESALNKPESPKPKATPPPSQQPAWMAEINKAKQRNADAAKSPLAPKHEVKIGGLIRSPPMGGPAKPLSIGGLPAGFSSGSVARNIAPSSPVSSVQSAASSSEALQRVTGNNAESTTSYKTASPLPGMGKTKPDTPPKKDFRTNLKPRAAPSETPQQQPEFKNALGQLRRTKTQNYVAPDELKNNIMRGKLELNVTGGPKKTERKDEFKEAILKKKEDFKKAQLEGTGVKRPTSGSSQTNAPLPEALAKKAAMTKSPTFPQESASESLNDFRKPSLQKESSAPGRMQGKEAVSSKLAERFNPALASMLARGPPSAASDTSQSVTPTTSQRNTSTSTTTSDVPDSGPQLTHMTKARARGPKRKAPSAISRSNETISKPAPEPEAAPENIQSTSFKPATPVDITPKPVLSSTRGGTETGRSQPSSPRKLDISTKPVVSLVQNEPENEQPEPSSPRKLDMKRRSKFLEEVPNKNEKTSQGLDSPKQLSPRKPQANVFEIPLSNREAEQTVLESKPVAAPLHTPSSAAKPPQQLPEALPNPVVSSPAIKKSPPAPLSPSKFKVSTPSQAESNTQENVDSESVISVRNAATMFGNQNKTSAPALKSPIKLPTQADEDSAMIGAGLRSPKSSNQGNKAGVSVQSSGSLGSVSSSKFNPISAPREKPLPSPPAKPVSSSVPTVQLTPTSPRKLQTQSSEASRLLTDFFGKNEFVPSFDVDTATVLSSKQVEAGKIKTLRAQLFQLSTDGKKQAVPGHQERLLFEGNMYLSVHTFGTAAGKKVVEVYFWAGDAVPDSVIEDADLFARKEAKAAGGKLVKIRQGKETSEFIEALGGILVIRRGTSNKYDSLAPHILCGRQFAGQIVFDEVDFAPSNLCSGFPYLISSQNGKSYLWKGRGSSTDELSCARLIGMDFGLMGEIEEIEDGKEPEAFLAIFGAGSKVMKSADHWRLKPSYQRYSGRLFCADSSSKSQISEIAPFSQADISQSSIYVLDAFFEIYVIVGARSQKQFTSFCTALLFAQEYGILAAGMEDRPFVPVSTVVLEGVPRDLKFVFRKWSDALAPTVVHSPTTALSRGRSLRVVPLNAALDAARY